MTAWGKGQDVGGRVPFICYVLQFSSSCSLESGPDVVRHTAAKEMTPHH